MLAPQVLANWTERGAVTESASGTPDKGERATAPGELEVPVTRAETIAAAKAAAATNAKKMTRSFTLTQDCVRRLRNASYWGRAGYLKEIERGKDIDMAEVPENVSVMVERAVWGEIIRLEKMLNGGEPFPDAPERFSPGPGASGTARLRQPRGPRKKKSGDEEAGA